MCKTGSEDSFIKILQVVRWSHFDACAQFPVAFQNVNIHYATTGSTKRSSAGLFCRIRTFIFMQSFTTFGTLQKALQIFQPVGPLYCLCQRQKRNNNTTNSLNHDLNQKTLWKVLLFTMNKTIFLQFLAWKSNTPKPTLKMRNIFILTPQMKVNLVQSLEVLHAFCPNIENWLYLKLTVPHEPGNTAVKIKLLITQLASHLNVYKTRGVWRTSSERLSQRQTPAPQKSDPNNSNAAYFEGLVNSSRRDKRRRREEAAAVQGPPSSVWMWYWVI